MNQHTTKQSKRRGQGMTEYILIVSLIAIASIGITTLFGNNLRNLFGMAADAIAGDDNISQRNVSGAGNDQKLTKKDLKSFAKDNVPQY